MVTAYAVVWLLGKAILQLAQRFGPKSIDLKSFELRLLQGFADVPQSDLLVLRQLLGLLIQLVEEIRRNWDELQTFSDVLD